MNNFMEPPTCIGNDFTLKDGDRTENGFSTSALTAKMQQDKSNRIMENQNQLLLKVEKLKQKLKKREKKITALQQKLDDSNNKVKQLIATNKALEEKNKKLGWLVLQKKFEMGEKLPESTFSGKSSGSILGLLDADISDLLL